jgi:hypothetical protein
MTMPTDRHVLPVSWFRRDPGGTTIYVMPPTDDLDAQLAQRREDLGLEPGESNPSRALGVVLLIFMAAVAFGIAVVAWVLWR